MNTNAPPLPTIDDHELYLEVYTHRDIKPPAQGDLPWGDSERLADLGAKALDAVVTYHFFEQRPCISAEDIASNRRRYTSASTLDTWLQFYDLKRKLRVAPNQSDAILSDPEEMKTYFHTYVGALCATKGLVPIQNWISKLIDPTSNPEQFSARQVQDGIGSQKSFTQSQANYHPPQFASSSYHSVPLPPAGSPPPLPSGPFPSAPLPSSPLPSAPFPTTPLPTPQVPLTGSIKLIPLSLVNQTAAQKGHAINYVASQEGPSHQPTWTVRCCINNVERGMGIAKSQKLAKEEAAQRAWLAMGW